MALPTVAAVEVVLVLHWIGPNRLLGVIEILFIVFAQPNLFLKLLYNMVLSHKRQLSYFMVTPFSLQLVPIRHTDVVE